MTDEHRQARDASSVLVEQAEPREIAGQFSRVADGIEDIKAGRMVIVLEDEDRDSQGILAMAAEKVTPQDINFMITYAGGLMGVSLLPKRLEQLRISMMVPENEAPEDAIPFGVPVSLRGPGDASVFDQAETVRALCDERTRPSDLVRPGHVFTLRANPGGVVRQPSFPEAGLDLARLAGCSPAGVTCGIMDDDGTMARRASLYRFATRHRLNVVTVGQVVEYRRRHEKHVRCEVQTRLPTEFGEFRTKVYHDEFDDQIHLVLIAGEPEGKDDVLVGIHSSCFMGDVLRSLRCDCSARLEAAMSRVQEEGEGAIVYMQLQQDKGSRDLTQEIKAYRLRDEGYGTPWTKRNLVCDPDLYDKNTAAQILEDLGLPSIRPMTGLATRSQQS